MIPPEESVLTRDDPTAFAPPPAFGPFRVLHQIGVGALGPVFRTYEPARDRLVAVKVFRLDITPEQAQALADELARAAEADLFHPSIVEPIAAGVEGTVAYRAEEYVAAESLDIAMRHEAPAPFAVVVRMVTQLGEAIDAARAAGVGHGALHPRDIFVTPQEARASGFGVVDALERVGVRAPVRRPYSAPERIAGAGWSTAADVFSLAAVAFELLTGRRPSGTGDQIGSLDGAAVANAPAVEAVLARAMAEDPAARFATGKELADALAAAGDVEGVAPPLPTPVSRSIVAAIPAAIGFDAEPDFADEDSLTEAGVPVFAAGTGGEADDETVEAGGANPEIAAPQEPDIEVERDEDLAQWELTREEAAAEAEAEAPAPAGRYADIEDEIASDDLAVGAADLALNPDSPPASVDDSAPRFLEIGPDNRGAETAEPPADPRVVPIVAPGVGARQAEGPAPASNPMAAMRGRAGPSPQQVIERESEPDHPEDRVLFDGLAANVERSRPAMLPLAVMLIVGLFLGFGAGYFVGGRNELAPAAASAGRPAAPPDQPAQQASVPDPAAATNSQAGNQTPAQARAQTPPQNSGQPTQAGGVTPAPAPPAATARSGQGMEAGPRSGRLVVRSSPEGAAVTIDGRWSGRTPLTRDSLAFGEHTVRIVLPGYQVHRQQVNLSATSAAPVLSVRLERESPAAANRAPAATSGTRTQEPARGTAPAPAAAGVTTGVLEVDSRPTGARVFVDDGPVGTTPVRLPDIAPGQHVVRMEMAGHQTWVQTAEVTRGRTTRVAGSLEPIR